MNTIYKVIYPILALIVVGLTVVIAISLNDQGGDDSSNDTDTVLDIDRNDSIVAEFTPEEVQAANTRENCLMIVNNNVYDVPSEYFDKHPGGQNRLLRGCGIDATQMFNDEHDSSATSYAELAPFFVGTVKVSDSRNTNETYSFAQVQAANDISENCLIIVSGNVYNIPESWAKQHPGGYQRVANACGTDATKDFTASHAGSQDATQQLEQYYVGVVE